MLAVVQFIHPGGEPPSKWTKSVGDRIPWHTKETGGKRHWRKFLVGRDATYRTKTGETTSGRDITFWGEWEQESITRERYRGSNPRSLQEPTAKVSRSPGGKCKFSTDPFVFGPHFLYTHCFQETKGLGGLLNLEPGSLILFGNNSGAGGTYRFFLDTVFVVGDAIPPDGRDDYLNRLGNRTLRATNTGFMGDRSVLYTGATPDDSHLYSYVPCREYRSAQGGFQRPDIMTERVLNNRSRFFGPNGWQDMEKPGFLQKPKVTSASRAEIEDLWHGVLEAVFNWNLCVGCNIAEVDVI